MNNERRYPIGYKPDIYSASLVIEFYDIKYKNNIQSPLYRKFLKTLSVPFTLIVLDDKKQIPTNNMKDFLIKKLWITLTGKKDYEKYVINIKEIKTINKHGKVAYDFDEFKD